MIPKRITVFIFQRTKQSKLYTAGQSVECSTFLLYFEYFLTLIQAFQKYEKGDDLYLFYQNFDFSQTVNFSNGERRRHFKNTNCIILDKPSVRYGIRTKYYHFYSIGNIKSSCYYFIDLIYIIDMQFNCMIFSFY